MKMAERIDDETIRNKRVPKLLNKYRYTFNGKGLSVRNPDDAEFQDVSAFIDTVNSLEGPLVLVPFGDYEYVIKAGVSERVVAVRRFSASGQDVYPWVQIQGMFAHTEK